MRGRCSLHKTARLIQQKLPSHEIVSTSQIPSTTLVVRSPFFTDPCLAPPWIQGRSSLHTTRRPAQQSSHPAYPLQTRLRPLHPSTLPEPHPPHSSDFRCLPPSETPVVRPRDQPVPSSPAPHPTLHFFPFPSSSPSSSANRPGRFASLSLSQTSAPRPPSPAMVPQHCSAMVPQHSPAIVPQHPPGSGSATAPALASRDTSTCGCIRAAAGSRRRCRRGRSGSVGRRRRRGWGAGCR